MSDQLGAALVGVAVLAAVWIVFALGLRLRWPLRVSDGADGRPSTSKFQFFLWTAVIVWGYVAVAARQILGGSSPGSIGMPTNLFILMGLGAGTAVAAKLVTVNRGGRPSLADPASRTYRSLIADDDGAPALEKIQVMIWTLVAAGIFVVSVWQQLGEGAALDTLPSVDDALLVLLGVGQGAYVAVKAIPRPKQDGAAEPPALPAAALPAAAQPAAAQPEPPAPGEPSAAPGAVGDSL